MSKIENNNVTDKLKFNGKLTEEELERLKIAGINSKQISEIEVFLDKYKSVLNGFSDIVGDDLIPTKQFFFNMKYIGYLLDENPDAVLSQKGVNFRKNITAKLIKAVGGPTMSSKQLFENRKSLLSGDEQAIDDKIVIPDEPVIWVPNHHFKDDAMATIQSARPFYFMFGSLPLYFNSFDGVLTYLVGAILINRKNKNSKRAALKKAGIAIDYGADLFWATEATHNKTANSLMLDQWDGVYRLVCEKGIKVVPVSHYLIDPTHSIISNDVNPIHTVVDNPIDLTEFPSEKAALSYLRDVISSWYYLMMEKYGKMSREELFHLYEQRAINYGINPEELIERPLTSAEIGTLYNMDLRSTVSNYDTSAEIISDYQDKNVVKPEEVFMPIANIKNPICSSNVLEAKKLVRERIYEDYQHRF